MSNDVTSNLPGLGALASAATSAGSSAESLATQVQNAILRQLGVPKSVLGVQMLREISEELGKLGTYLELVHDRVKIADSHGSIRQIEAAAAAEAFALQQLAGSLNDAVGYTSSSLDAAKQRGIEAAERIQQGPLTNLNWDDEDVELVTSQLGEIADDPVAAGAFFDELREWAGDETALRIITKGLADYQESHGLNSPRGSTQEKAEKLAAIDQALVDLGDAISGAHAADTLPQGFTEGLAETFTYEPGHLAVLLSYGTFSEDFLVELEDVMFTKTLASKDDLLYQSQNVTRLGSGFIDGQRNPFDNDAMAALLAATARAPGAAERILFPNGIIEDYNANNPNRKKWETYADRQNISYASGSTADGLALAVEGIVHTNVDDDDPARRKVADYAARDIVIALNDRSNNLNKSGAGAIAGVLAEYPDAIGDSADRYGTTHAQRIELGNPAFLRDSLRDLLQEIGKHDEFVDEVKTALVSDWDDYADGELFGEQLQYVIENRMTALGALTGGQSRGLADEDAYEKAVISFYIEAVATLARLAPQVVPLQGQVITVTSKQLKEWFAKPENREYFATEGVAGTNGQIGASIMIAAAIQSGKIKLDPKNSHQLEPYVVDGVVNWGEIFENPDSFNTLIERSDAIPQHAALDIDDARQEHYDGWDWGMGE